MKQAVLVNPFDVRGLEAAMDEAVNGDRKVHRRRMALLRRAVFRDDAAWWAREFLDALERRSDPPPPPVPGSSDTGATHADPIGSGLVGRA